MYYRNDLKFYIMLKLQAETTLPTDFGNFKLLAFSEKEEDWMPHLALIAEGTELDTVTNIRIHSECITGEIFHSRKCECGQQLDAAMKYISENGGIILYLRQEGRNIGIINKIKAYQLQEKGFDTVEANLKLGLPADDRDFNPAIEILDILGVDRSKAATIMHHYGYTGSACIPMAFDIWMDKGLVKKGDLVCFVGSGGGLAFGASLFRI